MPLKEFDRTYIARTTVCAHFVAGQLEQLEQLPLWEREG
jgi:hypothetical protein